MALVPGAVAGAGGGHKGGERIGLAAEYHCNWLVYCGVVEWVGE